MKIHLDNVNFVLKSDKPLSGPNSFAKRFAEEAIKQGHEIELDDGSFCDVSLVFIERTGRPCAKKIVQRIDGVWSKPSEFLFRNSKILATYSVADGIIYQSNFDKTFIFKHWGHPKKFVVVPNGISIKKIDKFTSAALEKIRHDYKKVFVCSANWHAQKRLKDNIALFQHIQNTIEPYSCLIVMGGHPDHVIASPHVFYTGSLSENLCLEIYSMADWMICLEWLSHCPNVVVEALSQQTPVICSAVGGASELVGSYGIQLNEQTKYDFTLEDYDNPPSIDVMSITSLPEKSALGDPKIFDIKDTVQSYLDFFASL